ncbi:MAG: OmpA family protein [Desulfobacterales bacterium]|nr:OmpA family protein [Desulfobacterales bacterium]
MKKNAIIVLSLVLAAAIISGLILYGKYADTKDALVISEKKLSGLNEKINQLDQEKTALHDKIEKDVELFGELENTKKKIEELENMITVKDQGLSEFEEKIHNLESDFEEVRKANEALFTELSSRNAVAMELKEKLEDSRSRITFLEDEIAKDKKEIEGFQDQLSEMSGEKDKVEAKMAQLRSLYDADLSELNNANERISELESASNNKDQKLAEFEEKLQNLEKQLEEEKKAKAALETELSYRDATTTELQEKLKSSQSRILYLDGEIAKGKGEIEEIQRQLSDLETEKALTVSKMDQLKSSYDINSMALKSANERISELENTISVKNQRLSSFEEELNNLEKQLEEEKKVKAALETELTYRDAATTELQEKLKSSQSRILFLEDEIAKGKGEIERLQLKLSNITGEKDITEIKIAQLKTTYENLVSDLKKQIENQEVTIKTFEEKISVTFVDRILFEFGKAKISPKGRMILGKIGNTLKNVQGKQIRVVGHTDDVPISPGYHYKFPSNWELSAARAASVVNYLQNEQGLDPANLEAVGRSFYEPIASNETSKGRAQNRRVNIIIVPKGD